MNETDQNSSIFPDYSSQEQLPNATAVLVLGIISIIGCSFGLILSIIALILADKDRKRYQLNPDRYTVKSYNNLNTGRICAIIGIIISCLFTFIFFFMFFALMVFTR